jgi:methionine-rich copper-binding protein CopC
MSKARVGVATLAAMLIGLFALLLALAAPALAHDELLTSSPADGATLTKLPPTVTLTFEEPPADEFAKMSVSGPDGALVNSTGPTIVGSQMSVHLKAMTNAGTYVISFRIMSDDGHPVSGTIHFTLTANGPAEHGDPGANQDSDGHAGSSSTLTYVSAAVVVVVALAGLAASRRRRMRAASAPSTTADREVVGS